VQVLMVRTVWAKIQGARRLCLVNDQCDFVEPVQLHLDHLTALEKSPNTLESYCRHLGRYFSFLQREQIDWRSVKPDDLVHFIQWLRSIRHGADSARANEHRRNERTVNIIVSAVSSFYRYHIQRGAQLDNPVLYEQISDRFSKFKRFLVHLSPWQDRQT
jgi:integrase/recombinase XerD